MRDFFKNYRVIIGNFTSLSSIQVLNYLIPIITIPYLVRVLGPDGFGLVNFAVAFISYASIITDFGFNLSAVKDVSIYRNNSEKISEIYSSVLIIKIGLLFVSAVVYTSLILLIPFFNNNSLLYLITFISIIGNVLFPVWFFQGIEKMKFIAFINFAGKSLSALFIFLFIKNESDYLLLPLITSAASVLIGVSGFLISISLFNVRLNIPSFNILKSHFNESLPVFISNIAINIYTVSSTFILGLLTNNTIVGFYSAADKIRLAVQGMFGSFSQSIFPHFSLKFKEDFRSAVKSSVKLIQYGSIASFALSLLIFIFAPDIINIIVGKNYSQSIPVLQILSFLPFIIFLSNFAGIQIMFNLGYKKEFMIILVLAALICIPLTFGLIKIYGLQGNAWSVVFTEIFVTVSMFTFVKKRVFNYAK